MATQIAKRLVFILIAALFLTLASSDAPFIVAYKKATLTRLKSGIERVSASIDIYNQGSAWSKDVFHIISGSTSMSCERLDVGALVLHAFELESEVQALFYGAPAVITLRIPTKVALQEAYSTPILPLDILVDRPPVKKFEWVGLSQVIDLSINFFIDTLSLVHLVTFLCFYMALWLVLTKFSQAKRMLAKYGSLISVISIMASFVYLVATPSKSNVAKGGKTKR